MVNSLIITPRTTNDLNEIIINGDIAKIKLYDRKQNEIGEAIIDVEDVDKVKKLQMTTTYWRHKTKQMSSGFNWKWKGNIY